MLLKVSMIIEVFPIQRGFLAPTLGHKYAFTTLTQCYTRAGPVGLVGRGVTVPPAFNLGRLVAKPFLQKLFKVQVFKGGNKSLTNSASGFEIYLGTIHILRKHIFRLF